MPSKCCSYRTPCHKLVILSRRAGVGHLQYLILLRSVVFLLEEMRNERAQRLLSHIGQFGKWKQIENTEVLVAV